MATNKKRLTIPLLNKNVKYVEEIKEKYKEYKYMSLSNLMIIATEYLIDNFDDSLIDSEILNNFTDSYNIRKKEESDKIYWRIGTYMPKGLYVKLKNKKLTMYKLINVALDKFYNLGECEQKVIIETHITVRENKLSS